MKYLKMFGLLAVAAAALMAFAGSASATEITSSTGSTPTFTAHSANSEFTGPFTTVKCSTSTLHGAIEKHGAGVAASGKLSPGGLTFTGCNYAVTVINTGALAFSGGAGATGNGTVTSSGAVIELHTSVGVCRLETAFTHIGSLTTGEHAVLNVNAVIPLNGQTSFFCAGNAGWKGTYKVTHPTNLAVH